LKMNELSTVTPNEKNTPGKPAAAGRNGEARVYETAIECEAIFDTVAHGITILDDELRVLRANRALASRCAASPEALVGRFCYELFGRCPIPAENCPARKALQTGQPSCVGLRLSRSEAMYLCYAYPMCAPGGDVRRVTQVLRDVTGQKGTRDRLEQLTERYRRLVEHAQEGIWEIDRQGAIVFANQRMADILGYENAGDMVGRRLHDLIARTCPGSSFLAGEKGRSRSRPTECALRKADGSTAYTLLSALPQHDRAGHFAGATVFVADVTPRRQAAEALRRAEARYRTLFDNAGEAIFVHDLTGRILDANQLACARLGYSKGELLGMTMAEVEAPEYAHQLAKRIQKLEGYGHDTFESVYLQCDGTPVPTEASSRLTEYEGQPVVLVIARDITERKQLRQAQLNTQRMVAMGQLAASISHEVNHPLQSILGNVEMLLRFPMTEEKRLEVLEMMHYETKRLIALTRQVLGFVKPVQVKPELVSVAEVIEYVVALARAEFNRQHIVVHLSLPPDLPRIEASRDELTQVFLNLTINAIDAMSQGGHLHVSARAYKGNVEVTLADTGPGIAPEMLDRIFEPFHTTKKEGTGLGLTVCHSIVRQHGGTIAAANAPEGGAIFTIRLPAVLAEGGDEPLAASEGSP